jgi:hypothetical protein
MAGRSRRITRLLIILVQSLHGNGETRNALLLAGITFYQRFFLSNASAMTCSGAMSQLSGEHYQHASDLYSTPKLLGEPYRICANTVKRHVVEFNQVATDVFQHSWNVEFQEGFRRAYEEPPFNRFIGSYEGLFEDNRPYEDQLRPVYNGTANDWSQVSWSISMSRVVMLMLQAERRTGRRYDRIIVMRPDGIARLRDLPPDVPSSF